MLTLPPTPDDCPSPSFEFAFAEMLALVAGGENVTCGAT